VLFSTGYSGFQQIFFLAPTTASLNFQIRTLAPSFSFTPAVKVTTDSQLQALCHPEAALMSDQFGDYSSEWRDTCSNDAQVQRNLINDHWIRVIPGLISA